MDVELDLLEHHPPGARGVGPRVFGSSGWRTVSTRREFGNKES